MGRREKMPVIPREGEVPLGTKIRARRWQQGLTLSQLASAAGNYDQSHLSHIENGRDIPSAELLETIARVLDITVAALTAATPEQVQSWLDSRVQSLGGSARPAGTAPRGAVAALPSAASTRPAPSPHLNSVRTSTMPAHPSLPSAMDGGALPGPVFSEAAVSDSFALTANVHAGPEPLALAPSAPEPPAPAALTALPDSGTAGTPAPTGEAEEEELVTDLTPEVLARVAEMLGATVAELEGASEAQLVAWLDDPAAFAAERAAGRLPLGQHPDTGAAAAAPIVIEAAPDATAGWPDGGGSAALPEAPETDLTPEVLARVAEMLGATVAELEGASEAQLVAWLDDPAAFAAERAAGRLPLARRQTGAAEAAPPAVAGDGVTADAMQPVTAETLPEQAAPAAAPLAPEMLATIAPVLGATVAELEGVPADKVLAWLDDPALFEQERRGPAAAPATAAPVITPAPPADRAPAPDAAAGPAASGAPLAPELLAMVAAALGATVAELEGVPADTLLAWLDHPELYHARNAGFVAAPAAVPEPEPEPPAAVPEPPQAPDAAGAADDRAAAESGGDSGDIPLELLTAVAQVIGTTPEALRGASELQLMAWFQDPDSFPGPRVPPPAEVVAAPAAGADIAAPATAPAGPAAAKAILPDDPSAFRDEYQIARTSTLARFRQLRELTARERLADRPDVLDPLLQRLREVEEYEDQVKAQGVQPAGYGAAPQQGSGPRPSSSSSPQPAPPRTAALSGGGHDRGRPPARPKQGSTSLLGAVGNWLGGLFGGPSKSKDGKRRK